MVHLYYDLELCGLTNGSGKMNFFSVTIMPFGASLYVANVPINSKFGKSIILLSVYSIITPITFSE